MESQFNICIKNAAIQVCKNLLGSIPVTLPFKYGLMRHASANEAQPEQRTHSGNLCPNSVPPAPTVLPVIHAPCGRFIKAFKDKVIRICAHIVYD